MTEFKAVDLELWGQLLQDCTIQSHWLLVIPYGNNEIHYKGVLLLSRYTDCMYFHIMCALWPHFSFLASRGCLCSMEASNRHYRPYIMHLQFHVWSNRGFKILNVRKRQWWKRTFDSNTSSVVNCSVVNQTEQPTSNNIQPTPPFQTL